MQIREESDPAEERLMASEEGMEKAALGIAAGIHDFLQKSSM